MASIPVDMELKKVTHLNRVLDVLVFCVNLAVIDASICSLMGLISNSRRYVGVVLVCECGAARC